ncbi:hypothetical protein RN001_015503 [Aquatica leii]|uniref:Protease inhibitor n=1 Tax=Aquatica leii TaxID=1421715 RepID=A0AAN7NZ93_9COLE|nr:hypothetical protein RN001_015503 [Aquatica leii]
MKPMVLIFFFVFSYVFCQDFVCQKNVPYKENNCNKCFCTHNSKLACLNRACNNELSRKLENCQIGTTSKMDCNNCWCIDDIGTVCTNNKC